MKLKPTILTLIISLCVSINNEAFAQDYKFSQVFSNPLLINPAYAGSLGRSRISASYRNQWEGELVTFGASYDQYIPKLSGGVGLQYISDKYNSDLVKEKMINGMYAYNLRIGENMYIRPAINIGLGINKIDISQFMDPFDPLSVDGKKYYFNAGAGLLFAWENLVSGISLDHINKPHTDTYSEYSLLPKLTAHINYLIDLNTHFSLTLGVVFQHQEKTHYFLPSLMMKIWYLKVGIASSSHINDPGYVIGMIGFENKWISLGYSYDFWKRPGQVSFNPFKGIYEFTAAFNFNFKKDKEEKRITPFGGF